MASNMADKGILNYQEQNGDIFDCSDNTIIDNSHSENDLTKLKTELLALKMFVSEQIYLLNNQSVPLISIVIIILNPLKNKYAILKKKTK